jgi:hypothetical protein
MHGGSKIDQSFIDKYSNRENADQTADFSTASTRFGHRTESHVAIAKPVSASLQVSPFRCISLRELW